MREFTRTAWASDQLQSRWEPRIQRINRAWQQVEIDSVREGIRLAALVYDIASLDLRGVRLTHIDTVPRDRYIVEREDNDISPLFAHYYNKRDDKHVGELLGFPPCCRRFFHRVWNIEQKKDTTLSMGGGFSVAGNILGRWLGVRLVPHLPCAFGCVDTSIFASHLDMLWPKDEWLWANEILNWPAEYSALHSIAEIKFPILKVITNTDYTKKKEVVRVMGTNYPEGAPRGLTFPFKQPSFIPIHSLKRDANEWKDNGFQTLDSMQIAHRMITAIIPMDVESIIDFGSGNGALLDTLRQMYHCEVVGLEIDAMKAARAKVPSIVGNINDVQTLITEQYQIGLISQRRFDEMSEAQYTTFINWAMNHISQLLIYSYDEPMFTRFL